MNAMGRRGHCYLHVMRRTLLVVLGFSLSLANMEDREPERREKSADTGRYWGLIVEPLCHHQCRNSEQCRNLEIKINVTSKTLLLSCNAFYNLLIIFLFMHNWEYTIIFTRPCD